MMEQGPPPTPSDDEASPSRPADPQPLSSTEEPFSPHVDDEQEEASSIQLVLLRRTNSDEERTATTDPSPPPRHLSVRVPVGLSSVPDLVLVGGLACFS
jgi:hypothetical protein